jgi:hypothetical protein
LPNAKKGCIREGHENPEEDVRTVSVIERTGA